MSDSKVGFHCKDVNSNWLGCLITVFPTYLVTERQRRYPERWKPSCALTVGISSGMNITQLE